ncbi:MAG TPA: MATE family efflux transporter [Candidatus Kapabacteria bacterium]|nr:MATE family efflux transporter [Candidatus Kapabacteria bacterium]
MGYRTDNESPRESQRTEGLREERFTIERRSSVGIAGASSAAVDAERRGQATPAHGPAREERNALIDGPIAPTLWRLAVPLAFGFIINGVYAWINMYFVSRLGDTAIAAIGFSDQINMTVFTIGSGFCIGTGIIVARRIGEGRSRQASAIATQAFSFMALYATLAAALLYVAIPHVLVLLQLRGEMLELTRAYQLTILFGLPANLLTFQANASIRSTGNTMFPMVVAITCAIVNALLDPVLIFGLLGMPKLGVQGAAIATTAAQWVGAVIATTALYSGRLNFRLHRPTIRFNRDVITSIFRLGVPSSLQSLSVSLGRVILISVVNLFGTAAVAAYTIGLRVDVLVMMPVFATAIAIETLVSQNIGARRFDRVHAFRITARRHLLLVVAAMGMLIYLFAGALAGIFTNDPQVAALTVRYLHIAVPGYMLFVIGQTATRALSGAGHALRSLGITAAVLWFLQIPLAYLLARFTTLGETGIFIGITASYLLFAGISTYAVRGSRWMMKTV